MKSNDLILRAAAIEICKSVVPNTNPDFYNLRSKNGYGCWMHSNGEAVASACIQVRIEKLSAVNAVLVVRCRDCKYGKLCFDADGHGLIQCTNTNYPAANVETWPFDLDWYCAGGERRDSE